jgi:hypothetical protein
MTVCLSILGVAAIAWAVVMLALIGLIYRLVLSREPFAPENRRR